MEGLLSTGPTPSSLLLGRLLGSRYPQTRVHRDYIKTEQKTATPGLCNPFPQSTQTGFIQTMQKVAISFEIV